MLVSIITVCFNSEKTIRKAIESVLGQNYPEIEYIVVDGQSRDGTLAIVKEYEEAFRAKGYDYRIISEKDNGIYDAMNKGIRMASGELIGMINSDDWYEPVAVQTAVEAYKQERFDLFYADINIIREDGSVVVKHSRVDKYPTTRNWNHPTTFVPKHIYEEVGLYACMGLYDDLDLILRIRSAGKKVVIKNTILANFRTGGVSNQKSVKKCLERCKDRYRCYRDNGYNWLYIIECVAMEFAKLILS